MFIIIKYLVLFCIIYLIKIYTINRTKIIVIAGISVPGQEACRGKAVLCVHDGCGKQVSAPLLRQGDGLFFHSGGTAARRHGFNGSAPRGVTDCNLTSQVGAFAAAFLCCTFSLPAARNVFFRQVRFGA